MKQGFLIVNLLKCLANFIYMSFCWGKSKLYLDSQRRLLRRDLKTQVFFLPTTLSLIGGMKMLPNYLYFNYISGAFLTYFKVNKPPSIFNSLKIKKKKRHHR